MKRSITLISVLVVVALLVLAGLRQVRQSKAEPPKSISELHAEKGVPVETAAIERGAFNLSHTYLGTVEGALQSEIMAMITKEVVSVPVQVGQKVRKGEVVCRLDSQTMVAQSNQARLAYEDAEREYKRMQNLFETGAISQQMLDKTKLGRDVAFENYQSASQLVDLISPIDGVVTDLYVRKGQVAMQGSPVALVSSMDKVKIKFAINYDDWKLINKSSQVNIVLNGGSSRTIPATITEIAMAADTGTRLFNVWVEADNRDGSLQPGLLVDTEVTVISKPDVILAPRDALISRNDIPGVFVIDSDKKAVFTPVKTAEFNSDYTVIESGLNTGESVVVYGHNNLSDGQLVNIVNQ